MLTANKAKRPYLRKSEMIDEKLAFAVPLLEEGVDILKKMGMKILDLEKNKARIKMPIEPNRNHIGSVYGGSLYCLAEFSGGVIFAACFDHAKYFPIVKEFSIRYRRPATTDMYLDVSLSPDEAAHISARADEKGKADFSLDLELKDESGQVCCTARGTWQLRKIPS